MSQTKAKLIYVGDPMCSWCYGIADELTKTVESLGADTDLQLIMGGLRPYNTETMKDLGDFLKEHWDHVNQASGQPFNYGILQDHSFVYDTEPPSRAVLVVRKLKPEQELAFFKSIQTAFYKDNKNTNKVETYLELAKEFGIDEAAFKQAFESAEMKAAVRADFQEAANLGIRSFPSLVLQKGEEYFLVANGYAPSEKVVKAVRSILTEN